MKLTSAFVFLIFCTFAVYAAPAPDFSLQDEKGNTVTLSDLHGQPVILHFWASWCPYCKKLQPALERFHQQHKEKGLTVLGVNFREFNDVKPQQVLQQRGTSFTTLIKGETVASTYKVKGTPTTFFIDRQGELVLKTNKSNPNDEAMQHAVEKLIQVQ